MASPRRLALQGYTYAPARSSWRDAKGVRETVDAVARELGLRATATSGPRAADAQPLGRARVGLYKPWVENIDEGWTRWLLEQYEFAFENIADADIRRGALACTLRRHRASRSWAPNACSAVMSPGRCRSEYAGGMGMDGADMLRQFVDAGGTLITLDSSSESGRDAARRSGRDVTRGLSPNEFFCPGSIVKLELDDDPLTYGVPRETAGFCASAARTNGCAIRCRAERQSRRHRAHHRPLREEQRAA